MTSTPHSHRDAVSATRFYLLDMGLRATTEVGVPGGRVDVLRLNRDDSWAELYEVKLHTAERGIGQLVRYGEAAGGNPALTLVVPPDLATDALREEAKAEGVRVWAFGFSWPHSWRNSEGEFIFLPYIHPESTRLMVDRWDARGRETVA